MPAKGSSEALVGEAFEGRLGPWLPGGAREPRCFGVATEEHELRPLSPLESRGGGRGTRTLALTPGQARTTPAVLSGLRVEGVEEEDWGAERGVVDPAPAPARVGETPGAE
eukprot:RCo007727